jgi:ankyrin repeat protein
MPASCLVPLMLIVVCCAACSQDPQAAAAARMRAWKAHDIFQDPVQRELAIAVERRDVAAIDAAIRRGADVNAPGKEGLPLLLWAMAKDSVVGFEALLRHGADLTAPIGDPRRAPDGVRTLEMIELVVGAINTGFLQAALDAGFDPDHTPDPDAKGTLLYTAVMMGHEKAAKILLAAGADVNWKDKYAVTPAGKAQAINDYKLVSLFFEHGADLTIKNKWGFDIADNMKDYGTRGVGPEQKPYFDKVVAELERRGLITQEDIVNADKPKDNSGSGITTIVHAPGSEAAEALRDLDRAEQEANRKSGTGADFQ